MPRQGAAGSARGCMIVQSGRAHTPSVLRRFDAAGGLLPASASGGLHRGSLRLAAALHTISGTACLPSIARTCSCQPGRTHIHGPGHLSLPPSVHCRVPALWYSSAPPMPAKSEANEITAPQPFEFGPGLRTRPTLCVAGDCRVPNRFEPPPTAPQGRPARAA